MAFKTELPPGVKPDHRVPLRNEEVAERIKDALGARQQDAERLQAQREKALHEQGNEYAHHISINGTKEQKRLLREQSK